MNRGPMSRLKKVPVKCRTCGKIKYNVVCQDEMPAEKNIEELQDNKAKQETENKPTIKTYKKPKHYNYIEAVVKKQNSIACKAYGREKEKD